MQNYSCRSQHWLCKYQKFFYSKKVITETFKYTVCYSQSHRDELPPFFYQLLHQLIVLPVTHKDSSTQTKEKEGRDVCCLASSRAPDFSVGTSAFAG